MVPEHTDRGSVSDSNNSPTTDFIRFLPPLFVLLVALSTAFKTRGNDIWWHIRTGQWIWENGAIPTTDPFSHTALGAPWAYTDWLSQLFFFALDQAGGADLLVWGKVAIVAAVAALLVRLGSAPPGPTVLGVCICGMAMHLRLVLKPALFSFVGFAAVWLVLLRVNAEGKRKNLLWLLPPILLLWGNFHRGGTIALFLILAALVVWALDRKRRHLWPHASAVLLLSVFALSANPGGFYYLTSAFSLSASGALRGGVSEWAPLSLQMPWSSIPWFLAMAAIWALGWMLSRRRADLETLVVAGTVVLSFCSVRFIPYAAMAMLPGLVGDLGRWYHAAARRLRAYARPSLLQLSLAAISLALLGWNYLSTYPPSVRGTGAATWLLPVDAAHFIKNHPPPGRMWNSLNTSGYLLYALAPQKKVFIDGRADTVYPMSFYTETLKASRDPVVLFKQLEEYHIGFAVVEYGRIQDASEGTIFQHPDWVLVYWGDRDAILVHRGPEASEYLSKYAYSQLRPETVLHRLSCWRGDPQDTSLAGEIFANLDRAPNSIRAHYLAALAYRNTGNHKAFQREMRGVEDLAARRDQKLILP
jgi:cbb3-type cytochrome oxidase subunit 3